MNISRFLWPQNLPKLFVQFNRLWKRSTVLGSHENNDLYNKKSILIYRKYSQLNKQRVHLYSHIKFRKSGSMPVIYVVNNEEDEYKNQHDIILLLIIFPYVYVFPNDGISKYVELSEPITMALSRWILSLMHEENNDCNWNRHYSLSTSFELRVPMYIFTQQSWQSVPVKSGSLA